MIRAVIFDWAGTLVDCGSRAPVIAFQKLFREFNVPITVEEARRPMGSDKKEHIKQILQQKRIAELFRHVHNRVPTSHDIDMMYKELGPIQLQSIRDHAQWIPGAVDTIRSLKAAGIKVGTCTGYSAAMITPLLKLAEKSGCMPDCVVTASDVQNGRPAPDMIIEACRRMDIRHLDKMSVWKVGDTLLDIREGVNAGVTSIGVTDTGNEMGCSIDELEEINRMAIFECRKRKISESMLKAGADRVLGSVQELKYFLP